MDASNSRGFEMGIRVLLCLVAAMALLSMVHLPTNASAAAGPATVDVLHTPIVIIGNAGFTPENGVVSGNGTETDPYIIEGWEFDSVAGQGIYLQSTDMYVVIRENTIHETAGSGGIELWYCYNVDIVNNTIYGNYQNGIFLYGVQDVAARSNNVSGNQGGIAVITSRNITLEDNSLVDDSIELGWSSSASDLSSHTIATSNTVNGNPVYYYKDSTGIVVDGTLAGELIIVNSADVEVMNTEASTLFLEYVDGAHVHDNNITGCDDGIYLYAVSDATVERNNVTGSESDGIYVDESTMISIVQNSVFGNDLSGIYTEDGDARVSGNTVANNGYEGISIHSAYNTAISENLLVSNAEDGIEIWYSTSVRVEGNSATQNGYAGAYIGYSPDTRIVGNNFSSNYMYGISMVEQVADIAIIGNNVSSNGDCGIRSACLPYETTGNITLEENTIAWNGGSGVYLDYTDNVSVYGNEITNNGLGIQEMFCESLVVTNNTVAANNGEGIYLFDSNLTRLSNNTCSHNLGNGMLVESSSNNTLDDNNCSSNAYWGIRLQSSDNSTLSRNNCSSNGYDGIMIQESNNLTLVSNRGFWNVYNGIDVVSSRDDILVSNNWGSNGYDGAYIGYSTNITMDSNNCSSNSRWGIQLAYSSWVVMFRNQICLNLQYGLSFWSTSSNNTAFNNTLIGNNGAGSVYDSDHIQAVDEGVDNRWNSTDGYGNYWSDWTSPDVVPPYGVVDVPYPVDGSAGSEDHFPLTTAVEPIPEFGIFPVFVMVVLATILLIARARFRN